LEHAKQGERVIGNDDVAEILDRLALYGIEVWVDGGWGVDALLGEQSRVHDDLDLVIARGDCSLAQEGLAALGFEWAADIEPGLPARLALRDPDDRRVDLHPVVFDDAGNGWQELPDGDWGCYSAEGLRGVGSIAQRRVRCLTPELQVRHHLGYEPDPDDHHDMRRLAERFQLHLPSPYEQRSDDADRPPP
jgi:lincosamide nucleotidyltransferase A/C/D/E